MQVLYENLYTTEQSRQLDKTAIEKFGLAGYTLMESAGTAVVECYRRLWPLARRILVLAGPGNNGGDGYLTAQLARKAGHLVSLVGFGEPPADSDASLFRQQWLAGGGMIIEPRVGEPPALVIDRHDLVVDAMLGTGLSRAPAEPMSSWIRALNMGLPPTIAVDVPSGLDSDTGRVLGVAVNAQATVTFIARKQGLFTGDGVDHCGDVFFSDLKVPSGAYTETFANSRLLCPGRQGLPMLPARPRSAHKGDHGHLLVIAGGVGMAGAAIIAGTAALRAGSGLVSVAVHPSNVAIVASARPEMMVHGIHNNDDLTPLLARADAVVIGPGLGTDSWAEQLWQALDDYTGPLVVDADALNLLARAPQQRTGWVLTPHVGEAARLLSTKAASIQQNRFAAVTTLQQKYSGSVLLKGAGTVIAGDTSVPTVIRGGNPGMASGGMGDALTGIIGAFLAQGLSTEEASKLGAAAHAWAGDLAARYLGERGLVAADLIGQLPAIINGVSRSVRPDSHGSAHRIPAR